MTSKLTAAQAYYLGRLSRNAWRGIEDIEPDPKKRGRATNTLNGLVRAKLALHVSGQWLRWAAGDAAMEEK